jgi:1-acyl-sn-glycerol-3-phosphate acyltransferase
MARDQAPASRSRPGSQSDRLSVSQEFWRQDRSDLVAALERHNRRVGSPPQRLLHRLVALYLLGPVIYLALRVLFRVRVSGRDQVERAGPRAILAYRHFYEWDPFVTFYAGLYIPYVVTRPYMRPILLAGQFWTRTRLRRALSLLVGVMGLARGSGREQSALRRARELLDSGRPVTIAVAPTGPIGKRREYEVRPGVAQLAVDAADVPVVPVTTLGVQDLRLGDLLLLRRPVLEVRFGAAFRARDFGDAELADRLTGITERIRDCWDCLEAAHAPDALTASSADARSGAALARA